MKALQHVSRCEVPDNRMLSLDPAHDSFIEIEVKHSDAAMAILKRIGFAHCAKNCQEKSNWIKGCDIQPKCDADFLIAK